MYSADLRHLLSHRVLQTLILHGDIHSGYTATDSERIFVEKSAFVAHPGPLGEDR